MARRNDRHHHGGERIDEAPEPHRREADHEAEPHMFGPPQRDDGAQHGEPQEQRRGEFVRPGQRRIEHVTRDHAGQQHQDFDPDQRGGGDLGGRRENPVEGSETPRRGVRSRRGHQALHRDGGFEATGHLQEWGRMRQSATIGGRWSFVAHYHGKRHFQQHPACRLLPARSRRRLNSRHIRTLRSHGGLVPAIHVFLAEPSQAGRGCPRQARA